MRISSSLFFQTGVNAINTQQADLMHLYQQVASGQRMVTPADDPLAAAQSVNIAQAQTLNARFAANREVAGKNLGIEENTLQSATTLLQDIKTRLIEAGNGTLSDADRATLSNVLKNAKQTLLGLANSTDGNGQYLFSGHAGSQPAFVMDASGKVSYNGDAGQRLIQADQTRQIASGDVGSDVFTRAASGSRAYVTSAAASNAGTGLVSKPVITDPHGAHVGHSFDIDFSDDGGTPPVLQYSITVRDVDGNLVQAPSAPIAYDPTTTRLDLPGGVQVGFSGSPVSGDHFSVAPVNGRASSGYVVGTPSSSDLEVTNPQVLATPATPLDETLLGKSFVVSYDGTGYEAQFLDTAGNPDGAPLALTLDAQGNAEIPGLGIALNLGGTPIAGDSVQVDPAAAPSSGGLNIFDTLDSVVAALETPITGDEVAQAALLNSMAGAIQRLDENYNQLLTVRSSVGARMNELDAIGANGGLRDLGYRAQLSKLEDLDYYTATAQLQLRQSALEAAAAAFKKIQSTSLFNLGN